MTESKKEIRKNISTRTRFEVFKRDGFKCAYCGSSPPNVVLHVDHIVPVSKNGANEMHNYITACSQCNLGKSNIGLDKIPAKLFDNMKEIEEKEKQLSDYKIFLQEVNKRETKDIKKISSIFSNQFGNKRMSKSFEQTSIKKFLNKLTIDFVENAMHASIARFENNEDTALRYFCGICWNKIKKNDPAYIVVSMWNQLCDETFGFQYYSRMREITKLIEKFTPTQLRDKMIVSMKQYEGVEMRESKINPWSVFITEMKESIDKSS